MKEHPISGVICPKCEKNMAHHKIEKTDVCACHECEICTIIGDNLVHSPHYYEDEDENEDKDKIYKRYVMAYLLFSSYTYIKLPCIYESLRKRIENKND